MTTPRTPRAGIHPIDDAATALAVVALALHRPPVAETVVLLLDERRCGRCVAVVTGTHDADAVVEVVQHLAVLGATTGSVRALVVASSRPDGGLDELDADRWMEMNDLARRAGTELVEWFVVGRSISCPRDLLGEPPRWRSAA